MQLFSFNPEIEQFWLVLTYEQPLVLMSYLQGTSLVLIQTFSFTIAYDYSNYTQLSVGYK